MTKNDQNKKETAESLLHTDLPSVASERMYRLPPYLFGKINALKDKLRSESVDLIDLAIGNPNDPTPQLVVDKLSEAAGIKTNQRYSVSKGIINLRKKLAIFYEKHWDLGLDPENKVTATIDSKEGFSHLCLGILGPGDVALTPAPYFPIHVYCPVIAGANVISVEMNDGNEVLLSNIDHMCRTVSPKPKVLILNFPHSPTVQTVELDFFEEIVKLANKYSFYVIHDFAYGLTTFDGYHAPRFLQAQGAKEVGVESVTMSKGYNMAGWRIGFVVGNPDIIKVLTSIKRYYDYGIFQAIQIATVIALRHCEENMKRQAVVYAKRRDCLLDGLNKAGWLIEKPIATMFVWAQFLNRTGNWDLSNSPQIASKKPRSLSLRDSDSAKKVRGISALQSWRTKNGSDMLSARSNVLSLSNS